jgi:perosamine synthetase
MIELSVPNLSDLEAKYLQECIDTNFVSSAGPFVLRFEESVANRSGSAYGVAVFSGTAGLHLALSSLGIGAGDLVIVPSYTFIASANAVSYCGAEPWLFDIDLESWTLDPVKLKYVLENEAGLDDQGNLICHANGRKVSAIMPVYGLGLPADMDPIIAVAKDYNLPIVADAAAAIGATYLDQPLGRIGADLTVFSFNGNKTVTAGGGGAIVGNDRELMEKVRHLSTTARSTTDYDHDAVGFNYRITNLQAAVGCAQLERLEELLGAKKSIRATYDKALSSFSDIKPFPKPDWAISADWMSGFILDPGDVERANKIRQLLKANNIEARNFWKPIHLQLPYQNMKKTSQDNCENIWQNIVTLPCSSGLNKADLDRVVGTVTDILGAA